MTDLPTIDQVGQEGTWDIPIDVDEDTEELITITGRFIGLGSSQQLYHRNHDGAYAQRSERCGACRWYETRIFRVDDGYVVHHTGASIVPDEVDLHRMESAFTASDVIDLYTTRPRSDGSALGKPAARALSQAAHLDSAIHDAYVQRAVS